MATQNEPGSETGQTASQRFFRYFQHEITALQEQMSRLGDTALVGGERKDATDHCLAGITRLSSEVKDASGTVPPYDLRTYTDAIKALQDKLAETQAQHAPKQRFSFKTRKNESAISLQDVAEFAAQKQRSILGIGNESNTTSAASTPLQVTTPPVEPTKTQQLSGSTKQTSTESANETSDEKITQTLSDDIQQPNLTTTSTTTSISAQSNVHIIIPPSASRLNTPCHLSAIKGCCVDLSVPTAATSSFASLTITNVQSSLLLCSTVAGPAHITGVKNSTILISCRQFRMHECENVDIYLYCTSRPIFEDCHGLRFSEMPTFYTDILHSARPTPSEAIGTNMWEHVDDFKWLRAEQSPNWMVLPSEDKVSEEMWKEIIPAKPGMGLNEILHIVSIDQ